MTPGDVRKKTSAYKEPQGELIALESYLKKVETPLVIRERDT